LNSKGNDFMKKTLVLAEKPSVGRDISKVLKCNQKGNGYMEGERYIVTWALGHLVTLLEPEGYDDRYKTWTLDTLPILPSQLKIDVIKQTGKQYNSVKKLMYRKDVGEIVLATDAGREGELVGRWIIEKANIRKPIKRLWISSVTDKAIKEGFNRLRDGKDFDNLYHSAVARAESDWYVGINATRALTCKYNAQLSCGRVQTPTLAIIAKRQEEIKNFVPKTFFGITAESKGLKFNWQRGNVFNKSLVEETIAKLKNKDLEVIEVERKHKKSFAPQLYDLTELQRDANKIFDFSAKETLSTMQRLYENHKILTYPRTDSRYLTNDIVGTLAERVKSSSVGQYSKWAVKIMKKSIRANKSFVDNSKVSDHHAIIPTEQRVFLDALSDRERKIYDLVVKRFYAVLYPPYEYEQIIIKGKIGEETFTTKDEKVLALGWKEIYQDETRQNEHEKQELNIKAGDILKISSIKQTTGETKPPAPFNEGTLLSAMEHPVKFMEDKNSQIVKTIDEAGGLGTVATRADIIEKLFNTFLIEKRGKDIFITSKGKQLLELVPEDLKSPALTGKWEQKLDKISKGRLKKDAFIGEIKSYTKDIVQEIKNSEEKFKHDNVTGNRCPECGKFMLEVKSKKGKMLVCQDRECGYRKGIAKITNARCPNCHKKLELRGQGEGQIFTCKCGYKEKLSSFNERKKKEKSGVSKKEAQKYIKKQKNEAKAPINSALADALSKLKLDK
jgi:DNA topoisomerase-3